VPQSIPLISWNNVNLKLNCSNSDLRTPNFARLLAAKLKGSHTFDHHWRRPTPSLLCRTGASDVSFPRKLVPMLWLCCYYSLRGRAMVEVWTVDHSCGNPRGTRFSNYFYRSLILLLRISLIPNCLGVKSNYLDLKFVIFFPCLVRVLTIIHIKVWCFVRA